MKLIALYRQDGRIIALSRVPQRTGGDAGIPMLRSGVAPGDGERVASSTSNRPGSISR